MSICVEGSHCFWAATRCRPSVTFEGTGEGQRWHYKPMPSAKLSPQFWLQQPVGLPRCPPGYRALSVVHCPCRECPLPKEYPHPLAPRPLPLCKRCSSTEILTQNHQPDLTHAILIQMLISVIICIICCSWYWCWYYCLSSPDPLTMPSPSWIIAAEGEIQELQGMCLGT